MSARVEQKGQPTGGAGKKVITEIVARLRSCFVHFRMRTYVLEYESMLRRVDTFASCGLQLGWKGKTGKSLHRSCYRRPVCVIKVSLSESVSRLNKVFRWTEFRVTLEENDMRASRWAQNRDCILSERLSILNLTNGGNQSLWRIGRFFTSEMAYEKYNCVLFIQFLISLVFLTDITLMLFFRSFLFNFARLVF